jgi:NADH-quinone oxidoreductase subunit K
MIPLAWSVALAAGLFAMGVFGILLQRSALRLLISVELILNAANINFVAFAHHHGNIDGLVFTLFVIALAAAEAAVGLGILIHLYRHVKTVDTSKVTLLRW